MLLNNLFRCINHPRTFFSLRNGGFVQTFATMEKIKELRTLSGAPIMDCKKALMAEEEINDAFEWLRKHGLAKISAKSRSASEGVIGLIQNSSKSMLLEVSSRNFNLCDGYIYVWFI